MSTILPNAPLVVSDLSTALLFSILLALDGKLLLCNTNMTTVVEYHFIHKMRHIFCVKVTRFKGKVETFLKMKECGADEKWNSFLLF